MANNLSIFYSMKGIIMEHMESPLIQKKKLSSQTLSDTLNTKLDIRKCSNLESATNYNFNERSDGFFYYDEKEKTITKSKWGNSFYMDNYNCPFRPGKYHRIDVDGMPDYLCTFQLGGINKNSLKNHNIIASLQYSEE